MTRKHEKAAKRFFNQIAPGVGWDYTDHEAKPLILAAFRLYEDAWKGNPGFVITAWEWPFNELAKGGDFKGNQPWAVLLRQAVALATPQQAAA